MKARKLLFALLTILLLCASVHAASYSDVSDAHWAHDQIAYLETEIAGYPDGTFRPDAPVSRAEFVTLLARIAFPDEWKQASGGAWWQAAYEVCTAHNLFAAVTGSRTQAMPRGEIASVLGTLCHGWGGINERADAAEQAVINWKEQRMQSREWQPLFSDTADMERSSTDLRTCANQGLLTGYPDGSFRPKNGVTRAEAAAILARLKAQLAMREKSLSYVCTVGQSWLMQDTSGQNAALALYAPLSGKEIQTVHIQKDNPVSLLSGQLLTGSDGIYVWGLAGLYQRRGNTLEQITSDPVLDFCWYGDNTLYYLSWEASEPVPTYSSAAMYFPCASRVMKLTKTGQTAEAVVLAERDEENSMQNLTDICVESGTVYVAGSYCMGMMDVHTALYEAKDGKLVVVFGEY